MFAVETVDDLWNFIAYVLGGAPNYFPKEDYLSDDDQMTLEKSMTLLRRGVEIAYPEAEFSQKRAQLNQLLDKCYLEYKKGDEIKAGHLLNEFQDKIFKET